MSEYMTPSQVANAKAGDRVLIQFAIKTDYNSEGDEVTASLVTGEDGALIDARETKSGVRKGENQVQRATNAMADHVAMLGLRAKTMVVTVEAEISAAVVEIKQQEPDEKEAFDGMDIDLSNPFDDNAEVTPAFGSATGTGG